MTDIAHEAAAPGREALGREAAVFDRIEAFRRRRPRLLDDVVTLAQLEGAAVPGLSSLPNSNPQQGQTS